MNNAIRLPLQTRSREKMDRVLNALEEILDEKSFEKITLQELAARAGVGISSIYARFADKKTLMLAVHERLNEQAKECIAGLTDPESWKGAEVETVVSKSLLRIVKFYRKHKHIVRAADLVDLPFVYERIASAQHAASERFAALVALKMPDVPRATIERRVDAAVRVVTAVMHQELLFGSAMPVRRTVSDTELRRQLTTVVLALLKADD